VTIRELGEPFWLAPLPFPIAKVEVFNMAKPWKVLDTIDTDEGVLELRQRDDRDFLNTVSGLVLMNSMANRSEVRLPVGLQASAEQFRALTDNRGVDVAIEAIGIQGVTLGEPVERIYPNVLGHSDGGWPFTNQTT
jgi:hypothetical protein